MLPGGLPFSLISFNDDTDPTPGVRGGRVTVVLEGGFDIPPVDDFEMDGVLLAASVIEARGLIGGLTVPGSGEGTIEVLDGGLALVETDGLDERVSFAPMEEASDFLSAEGWTLGGTIEVLRVWVGTGGLEDCIAAFVGVDGLFFTGEAVGEGLTPEPVTLDRAGFVPAAPTT